MCQPRRWGFGLLALALSSCSLPAQENHGGGQLTVSLPNGELGSRNWLHRRVGAGAGIHALVGLQDGYGLVPRFDYISYEKKPVKVQTFQLGVDLDYYFSGRVNEGPYLGGGLLVTEARLRLTSDAGSAQASPRAPGAAFIAGWMYTQHLGAELRWGWTRFKANLDGTVPPGYPAQPVIGAQTMNASLVCRF
jgi:hypothetical protein